MLAALRESRENRATQFVTDARQEGDRQRVIKKEKPQSWKTVFCFVFLAETKYKVGVGRHRTTNQ